MYEMIVDNLDLGFAKFNVTVNGKTVPFQVEQSKANVMRCVDGRVLCPKGCLDVTINVLPYQIGDIILAEFNKGELQGDGGGERMLNIVGEIAEFTVAMGAPDTDEYEEEFRYTRKSERTEIYKTNRALPYETSSYSGRGFEFQIVDAPHLYNDRFYRTNIVVILAWEHTSNSEAWNLVSCLTC